tara:strand:+ start:1649 stop:1981 length:333 start_codon:yes stop_codon:yes gene_type:complete
MNTKRLQVKSQFEQYDLNEDGIVSDDEIARAEKMMEMELREEKLESQKNMAWVAIVVMIISTIVLFSPIIPDSRVNALSDLLGLYFISLAGIAGTYMGATAWVHSKSASK